MNKMIKAFCRVGFLVLLSVFLPACSSVFSPAKTGSLERILQNGKLVISTSADYAPQSENVAGEVRLANTKGHQCWLDDHYQRARPGLRIIA